MFTQSFILLLIATVVFARWCCDPPTDHDESVAKLVQYDNHNNDSVVDLEDIIYDLDHNFDINKDNKTSKVEWVLVRDCLFGEDSGYALFLFASLDRNKDGFITRQDIAMGPVGTKPMPVAAFAAMNRQVDNWKDIEFYEEYRINGNMRYQDYQAGKIVGK